MSEPLAEETQVDVLEHGGMYYNCAAYQGDCEQLRKELELLAEYDSQIRAAP
jgi:hypothetical protein